MYCLIDANTCSLKFTTLGDSILYTYIKQQCLTCVSIFLFHESYIVSANNVVFELPEGLTDVPSQGFKQFSCTCRGHSDLNRIW